jgi:hypothetical protein
VNPSQYSWSMASCACMEVCLPSRNLETDCVTPMFHCLYVYYLETTDSLAQPFLHGANKPQYLEWRPGGADSGAVQGMKLKVFCKNLLELFMGLDFLRA